MHLRYCIRWPLLYIHIALLCMQSRYGLILHYLRMHLRDSANGLTCPNSCIIGFIISLSSAIPICYEIPVIR